MSEPQHSSAATPFRGWFGNILTWVILACLIRMIGLTQAPIERSHSWRQAFTNMVARNLEEGHFDLLHPRTDLAGERPDVVASEFPLFNALIAGTSMLFGASHWYGRAWALVFSSLGVLAFHALVRRRYGRRIAFIAAFVLLWSSWFIYGRKSMPDTFSISLVLFALLAVDRALSSGNPWWFVPATLLGAAGALSKIPAAVLLMPWAAGCLDRRLPAKTRWLLGGSLFMAMIPVLWWYFQWVPHLLRSYGNPLFFPRTMEEGLAGLAQQGHKLLERFRFSALLSHVASVAAAVGAWSFVRGSGRSARLALGLSVGLFAYFMVRAGDVFAIHAYYMLPFVPVLALLAGVAMAGVGSRLWLTIALLAIVLEGAGIRFNDLISRERYYLSDLEERMDRFTTPAELIATSGGTDPRLMYFAHRHGWSLEADQLRSSNLLDSLSALGLRAIVVDRSSFNEDLARPLLFEDEHLRIFDAQGHMTSPEPTGQAGEDSPEQVEGKPH